LRRKQAGQEPGRFWQLGFGKLIGTPDLANWDLWCWLLPGTGLEGGLYDGLEALLLVTTFAKFCLMHG
jgi:hypothetical protein